jgi:phenylpyruvate tautomerase PptA (4-oxalocrotonate tautomerase family)
VAWVVAALLHHSSAGLSPCARRSIADDFSPRGATMPLTRVSLLKGKPPEYRKAILDGLYQAMRESFGVPEDDRFMLIEEYDKSNFNYGENYLGIARDDDLVIIQITVNNTRGPDQKKALFARIAEILSKNPGIRPENILVNLLEVPKENWSFGDSIAQYA